MRNAESDELQALLRDALVQIRGLRTRLSEAEARHSEPVAIIGTGCRFPGGVYHLESFWQLLHAGVDAVGIVPPDRWDIDALYHPDPATPGRMYTRYGSFLQDIGHFDASFFGISPTEAKLMDPQQRLMLEVAWEALEDAGLIPETLRTSRTGVFVGVMYNDYAMRQVRENGLEGIGAHSGTGSTLGAIAGRLAYVLGLQGPTLSVDTACSSSLVSVHLACQSLRNRECDLALAGGVNAILSPEPTINLSKARMMSPTGRCRTFDAAADGYVRGEGAGVVVLKRLSQALADGDHIWAVIRGSAMNQDGRSNGMTAPNGVAQRRLLLDALASAGLSPEEIGYVECHGTGTPLGDPIEVSALIDVLARGRRESQPLALGSVKTNYGHLESAAGICALLKTVLVLNRKVLPPHLHFKQLNPHISLADAPVVIPTRPTPWFQGSARALAGVSGFGFSGTNCHVILEAPPARSEQRVTPPSVEGGSLLTLSAKTREGLQALAARHRALWDAPEVSPAALCAATHRSRSHFEHRLALPVFWPQTSENDVRLRLDAVARGLVPSVGALGHAARWSVGCQPADPPARPRDRRAGRQNPAVSKRTG